MNLINSPAASHAQSFIGKTSPGVSFCSTLGRENVAPATSTARLYDYFTGRCLNLYESDARALQKAFKWSFALSIGLGVRSAPSRITNLIACAAVREKFGGQAAWPAGFYTESTDTTPPVDPLDDFGEMPAEVLRFNSPRFGLLVPVVNIHTRGLQVFKHPTDPRPMW